MIYRELKKKDAVWKEERDLISDLLSLDNARSSDFASPTKTNKKFIWGKYLIAI